MPIPILCSTEYYRQYVIDGCDSRCFWAEPGGISRTTFHTNRKVRSIMLIGMNRPVPITIKLDSDSHKISGSTDGLIRDLQHPRAVFEEREKIANDFLLIALIPFHVFAATVTRPEGIR